MSSRSSTSTLQASEDYLYLFRELMVQAADRRSKLAAASQRVVGLEGPGAEYPPASTDENNVPRSSKGHATTRKPAASTSILVTWNGPQDPQNPMNWSWGRKRAVIAALCCISFSASFSSSVFAPAVRAVAAEFGVSIEVAILGDHFFGDHFQKPTGRTRPLFFAFGFFVMMQIPVAVAQNLTAVLLCRFLAGAFSSAVFAIPPALAVDFLDPVQRSKAVGLYITFLFLGPAVGPIVGSYLTTSLGWRWTGWVSVLVGGLSGIFALLAIPESSEAVLLQRKAARLRSQTHNWALHAKLDEIPVTFASLRNKYLFRLVHMILQEPILIVMTIYTSLVYGILYLIFFTYPYAFQGVRGWCLERASLPFLAIIAGVLSAGFAMAVFNKVWWLPRFIWNQMKVNPEDRIPPLIASSIILPAGLLWFAWTSNKNITRVPQILAGIPIGAGIMLHFLSGTAYLIDVYLLNANSALAANIFIRSASAAAFPLLAKPMNERLGVAWATTLPAFLCVAMIPFPIVLWMYGKKIRGWSRYSFDL